MGVPGGAVHPIRQGGQGRSLYMKMLILTPVVLTLAMAASSVLAADPSEKTLGEKTSDVIEKAADKTKEAGKAAAEVTKDAANATVDASKRAAEAVKDAVSPDPDARRVDVRLVEHKIEMPAQVASGKTAFVVTNTGSKKHNFEIEGQGIERKFVLDLAGGETKTLHADLKPGTYKVYCPVGDHAEHGMQTDLIVK